ncbi:hypothetical protein P261_02697 [Lachnospiraceae bacterium TWA4]|nr:hypothetical protein P261_02697 [Lachnospiraceae bacterium TWA4]
MTIQTNQLFQKYKQEILDSFMKKQGFVKYKTNSYIRLNEKFLVECICIKKSKIRKFTLLISLAPLYVPNVCLPLAQGFDLGKVITNANEKEKFKSFWWDYREDKVAKESFENVVEVIEQFVLPWFSQYLSPKIYQEDLKNGKILDGNNSIQWLIYFL